MLDVLHHLAHPTKFFQEAARVLKPGGRMAMIEPGVTPVSWPIYKFLHQEPIIMSVDPFDDQPESVATDPFLSNQGLPTLLFDREEHRSRFERQFPEFRILEIKKFSFFAYPLSGGFQNWSLLPVSLVRPLLKFEELLSPLLGPGFSFRISVILEHV